jgi:hypothetical protein
MSSNRHSGLDYFDKPPASANYGRIWPAEKPPEDLSRLGALAALQCELVRLQPCDAIKLLLDRTREIAGADLVTLGLFDGPQVIYRYASGAQIARSGFRLSLSGTLAERCVRTGSILAFDAPKPFPLLNGGYGTASSGIVCPIFNEGRAIGTLEVFSGNINTSDDSDIDLVQVMAGLLGGVLAEVTMQAMKHLMTASTEIEDVSESHPNVANLAKPAVPGGTVDVSRGTRGSLDLRSPSPGEGPGEQAAHSSEEWDDSILSERENDVILSELEGQQAGLTKDISQVAVPDDAAFGQQEQLPKIDIGLDSLRTSLIARDHVLRRNKAALAVIGLACAILVFVVLSWKHFSVSSPQTPPSGSSQLSAPKSVAPPPADALSIPQSALGLTKKTAPRTHAAGANGITQLVGIRYWNNGAGVVVALQLTGKTQVEAHRIDNPDRIYFDMHHTTVWQSLNGTRFKADGPVLRQIRASDRGSNVTRVTLQLQNPAAYEIKTLDDLNLFVIELPNPIPSRQ